MKIPTHEVVEVFVHHKHLNDLKILHLSDLHINKKMQKNNISLLVESCINLEYDFAVITGDIIDCNVKYIKEKLQILSQLALLKPVYYISGNHDVFFGLDDLRKELNAFIFLDNKIKHIHFNNNQISIIGLADRFSKFFKVKRDEKKVIDYLKNNDASIFISHQPKDYKIALKTDTNLFLCGHTHGGQIFPFHLLVRLFQPFLSGLFYKKKTAIYVNKGLGTWGIDYRFKADCEITILKLISSKREN
jgi:predicted MPP superfamily phosphohydrolase